MDERISVVHFSNSVDRGGAEEHILTLLRGFDRKHFRLHLVCTPEVAESLRPDLPSDIPVFPLRLASLTDVAGAWKLAGLLHGLRPQILHSHLFCSSLFASPLGWICKVPVALETPHLREMWRKGWFKSHFVVDRLVGICVDFYIAVSESNARYLANDKGLPPEKLVVIHNGCDLTRFSPSAGDGSELRRRLGLDKRNLIIVVPARLEPQKGHRVLIEALPKVLPQFPQVRVVCIGEGSLRTGLEEKVRGLGLKEIVRFVGFQKNVPEWLVLADLTVLPSLYEGLPLAAIESLAAARAIVATAVDGTPEIVVDGKAGLTVPPDNPERLASAICTLLRDASLRQRMGTWGRRWVCEHFSEKQQVQKTEELYLEALRLRNARRRGQRVKGVPSKAPLGEKLAAVGGGHGV